MKRKFILTMTLLFAFLAGANFNTLKAQGVRSLDLSKQYRVKATSISRYLYVLDNIAHASGPNGGVVVYQSLEDDNQLFTLEDAGGGAYYFKSASGYYIYCQTWNVDAYSATAKTALKMVDQGDGTFYLQNTNSNEYFKVEQVGWYYYPFCNCDGSNGTIEKWTLEAVDNGDEPEPTPNPGNSVTIGSGNSTDSNIPARTYYGHSASQQIYTASEINHAAGTITKIAFKGLGNVTRTWEVYLANTNKTAFASTTDWVTSGFDKVFDGQVTIPSSAGWFELSINNFNYTGNNILVCVIDKTNVGISGPTYYIYSGGGDVAVNATGCNAYEIGSLPGNCNSYVKTFKNQIKLTFDDGLQPAVPQNLTVTNVTHESVTLTWSAAGNANTYNIYKGGVKVGETANTSYTVTGLNSETTYAFTVTGVRDAKESSPSNTVNATTTAAVPTRNIVFELNDTYGDSWSGNYIEVYYNDEQSPRYTLQNENLDGLFQIGETQTEVLSIPEGTKVRVEYIADGNYYSENNITIYYQDGSCIKGKPNFQANGGNNSGNSFQVIEFTVGENVLCLDAPYGLYVIGNTTLSPDQTTEIRWTAPNSDVISYNIYSGSTLIAEDITDTSYDLESSDLNHGYNNITVSAVYAGGESEKSNSISIRALGWFTLNVNVTDGNGDPVSGATVQLTGGEDELGNTPAAREFTTDANGNVTAKVLSIMTNADSKYTITVSKNRYVTVTNTFGWESTLHGSTLTKNITIELQGPSNVVATPNQLFVGESTTISWDNAGGGVTYNVYVDDVKHNTSAISTNSYTISNLSYNMNPGHVVGVTAVYAEGETSKSTVDVKVAGTFTLTVNVTNQQGQPIQGATVNLDTDEWTFDELGNKIASYGEKTTGANGQAVYQNVKLLVDQSQGYSGYSVNVSKGVFGEAFQVITNYAEITNGDNYELDFEMSLPAPRNVSATGGNSYEVEDDVELTWEKPEGVTDEVLGYNIYKVEGGYGGSYTKLNGSLVTELTYTVTDVESGQYSLGVSAVYAEGESSVTSYYINVAGRARLIGTVVNAEDDPISGAEIAVYGYDMSYNPVSYEGITTDKNGKFTIDPISPSDNSGYTIEATALGYYDYSSAGNKVANDVDTKITIVMRSEPSVDIEVRAVDKDTYADVSWDWPMTGGLTTKSADLYRLDVGTSAMTELATGLNAQGYKDNDWETLPNGEYQYGVILSVDEKKQHFSESFETTTGIDWRSEDPTKWSSYELNTNGTLADSDRGRWIIQKSEQGGVSPAAGEKHAVSPNPTGYSFQTRYIMVSPLIDLTEAYLPKLSFYYHTPKSSSSAVNGLKVLVLTESQGKMAADDAEQLWYNNESSTSGYTLKELDLTEYVGEKIYLVFDSKLNMMKTYVDMIDVKSQTQSWNSRITWSNSLVKGAVVFTGTGNWKDAARWNTGSVPTESDDVTIKGQATVDDAVSVNSINIARNESIMGMGGGDEYSMTLEPTAVLRVTKGIANSGSASNLLIKDGAQLYQNAVNVDATFVMDIDNPITWETDHKRGWQIIASPLKEASTNSFKPADSDYDLYKYDGTQELQWVNHKFHTSHNPSLLYDFEDGVNPGNYGFTFPVLNTTNTRWKLSSEAPVSTNANIVITSNNIGSDYCMYSETLRDDNITADLKINNWMVLPEQRIVNGTYLKFKVVSYYSPGSLLGQTGQQYVPEVLEILVSENLDYDDESDFKSLKEIQILNGIPQGNTEASWEVDTVDLSAYAEKNVYIALRHKKIFTGNVSQAIFIDDIRLINESFSSFEEDFVQGRGYMASYESEEQATFTGELNHESEFRFKDVKGYNGGDRYENFYLLGNPFTFNMNWDGIQHNAIVEGYATVDADGSYQYFKDGDIKVGDGFFVQTIGNDPYVEYTSTRRRIEKNYLNLIATGKNGDDNLIIDFSGSEEKGFNKLENFNDEIAELYILDEGYRYAIKNFESDVEEVEVRFDAKHFGRYTISAVAEGNFETVILVDRTTGIETNLLVEDYTFTSTTDEAKDRFVVRMVNSQQTTDDNQFVYQSGEELIVNAKGMIQIVDVLGRVVYQSEHSNDINRINVENLDNATYVLRCVNGSEVKTQKIVIL